MTTTADDSGSVALARQMRALLEAHWSDTEGLLETMALRRRHWFAVLDERNWRVPGWPRHAGGEGWSDATLARWQRLCALAGAPLPDPVGSFVLGPLLQSHGTPAQRRDRLPAIRLGIGRWHLAGLPGLWDGASAVRAEPLPGDALCLQGSVRLSDPVAAEDGLCLATPAGLLLVDLAGAAALPARRGAPLGLDGLRLGSKARLGPAAEAETLAWRAQRLFWQALAPAARARRLLALIGALPVVADGHDDDLRRRLVALEAAVYGIEALARRSQAAPRREDLALLLALRSDGLLTRLDALGQDALGYRALPATADPARGDNRPRIGHHSGPSASSAVASASRRPSGDAEAAASETAAARLQAALDEERRQPALAADRLRDRLAGTRAR